MPLALDELLITGTSGAVIVIVSVALEVPAELVMESGTANSPA
jgi:hypothetical protein